MWRRAEPDRKRRFDVRATPATTELQDTTDLQDATDSPPQVAVTSRLADATCLAGMMVECLPGAV
jgi:hypothetical protein